MNIHVNKTDVELSEIQKMMVRYNFSSETINNIENENLLPSGLIKRLHSAYAQYSGFFNSDKAIFTDKTNYSGLKGFREIVGKLKDHGIEIGHLKDREFFIEVYRFLATKHVLNTIDWSNYKNDSNYYLNFPQPGMIKSYEVKKYIEAKTDEERKKVVEEYQLKSSQLHPSVNLSGLRLGLRFVTPAKAGVQNVTTGFPLSRE